MGVFVIAAYRPKKGKERLLRDVLKDHVPILRKERLVTDRPPYLMRAAEGTLVEGFEWKSAAAIEAAHSKAAGQAMGARFEVAWPHQSLGSLRQLHDKVASFPSAQL